MPAKSDAWWRDRLEMDHPCHYLDPVADWSAGLQRRAGVSRVWPIGTKSVLDAGCGDGRVGQWMEKRFDVRVTGADPFEYKGVRDRVSEYHKMDCQKLASYFGGRRFDLITFHTSLCCMENWDQSLASATALSDRFLIVENTQSPTPEWQKGWDQKDHLALPKLNSSLVALGYDLEASTTINKIDRRWSHWGIKPVRWLGSLIALPIDLLAHYVVPVSNARYTALLYRRQEG